MLPHVVIHNGVSVDGRMDIFAGDVGLYYMLAGRWDSDAMLSGSNTMLAALASLKAEDTNPDHADQLEVEPEAGTEGLARQLLVIVDSRGRIREWGAIRNQPYYWRDVLVLCSQTTPDEYLDLLQQQGIAYIQVGIEKVDLRAALERLYHDYDVKLLRVDSGGVLNGALLRAGLVDEVSLLIAPNLVGGESPASIFRAPDLTSAADTIQLRLVHLERLAEEYVWLKYEVVKP